MKTKPILHADITLTRDVDIDPVVWEQEIHERLEPLGNALVKVEKMEQENYGAERD